MAINLHCSVCKSSTKLQKRRCKVCGNDFSKGKKYRVVVKFHSGKRITRVVDTLSLAKSVEGKLRTQAIEKNLSGINQIPLIDDAWKKYPSPILHPATTKARQAGNSISSIKFHKKSMDSPIQSRFYSNNAWLQYIVI